MFKQLVSQLYFLLNGTPTAVSNTDKLPVEQDSGENEYIHVPITVTAAGDTTIYTPAAGKRVVLRWIYAINDPTAATAPLITIKLGGVDIYKVWALSKRQKKTGAVNAPLVINLSTTGTVAVTAVLEEI